jgi:hypothetical protein
MSTISNRSLDLIYISRKTHGMESQAVVGRLLEVGSAPNKYTPSFKKFPKLPLELRLKIWYFAFPEPRVLKNLSVNEYGSWNGEPFSFHDCPPVSLFVNRESRSETLMRYRDLSVSLETSEKSVYFSPVHDAVYLGSIVSFTEGENSVEFLAWHTTQIIEQLSPIQNLILDGLYMDRTFRKFLLHEREHDTEFWTHYRDEEFYRAHWKWDGDGPEIEGGMLAKFHGLKKLFLIMNSWENTLADGATVDECKELFRRYFEIERQKWPNCRIPEIAVILPGETMVWPE